MSSPPTPSCRTLREPRRQGRGVTVGVVALRAFRASIGLQLGQAGAIARPAGGRRCPPLPRAPCCAILRRQADATTDQDESNLEPDKAVKRYGAREMIHGVDLRADHGEFCVLVAPSVRGKSTLLQMIAGLERIADR
jgi:ABC-type glutathione transport system ATPase component